MTADTGWEESRSFGKPSFDRIYDCGAKASVRKEEGSTWSAHAYATDADGKRVPLLAKDFQSEMEAKEACSQAILGSPSVEQLELGEAYHRLDHGGESKLVADVVIDRGAIEEKLVEDLFQDHDGAEITFSIKPNGDYIAHLRVEEEE